MTLGEVFQILRDRDASLVARDGSLRYISAAPLSPADPLRAGIAEHRAVLIEMFTYAPGGRCVTPECLRLRAPDGGTSCPDHVQIGDVQRGKLDRHGDESRLADERRVELEGSGP